MDPTQQPQTDQPPVTDPGTKQTALDLLRSLLGGAFSASTVTTPYGAPGALNGLPHTGIDLAAAEGTPIREVVGGKLQNIWTDNVGGNQVAIRTPNGFTEVYAHLSSIPAFLVTNPNADVPAGATIGYAGSTGMATGPHLHYEVVKPNGRIGTMDGTVDPLAFVGEFARPLDPTGHPVLGPASDPAADLARYKARLDELAKQVMWGRILGVPNTLTDAQVAETLRREFPTISDQQKRQAAFDQINQYPDASQVPALGGIASALASQAQSSASLAANVTRLVGDLTDPQRWARVGLTLAAVGLIGVGLMLYARPSIMSAVR